MIYIVTGHPRSGTKKIRQEVDEAVGVLRQRRDVKEIVELWYTDVLANPVAELARLGWPFHVELAAAVVDPSQQRYRLDELEVGL